MQLLFLTIKLLILSLVLLEVNCQNILKILVIAQSDQFELTDTLTDALKIVDDSTNGQIHFTTTILNVKPTENATQQDEICRHLESGHALVLDITWGDSRWKNIRDLVRSVGLPYFKIDVTISGVLRMMEAYLKMRNATDIALILDGADLVNEAIVYLIDNSTLRAVLMDGLDEVSAGRLRRIRPLPSFYVVVARTSSMAALVRRVQDNGLLRFPERWNLLFTDLDNHEAARILAVGQPISVLSYSSMFCCMQQGLTNCDSSCSAAAEPKYLFLRTFTLFLGQLLVDMNKDGDLKLVDYSFSCVATTATTNGTINTFPTRNFMDLFRSAKKEELFTFDNELVVRPKVSGVVDRGTTGGFQKIAKYSDESGLRFEPGAIIVPIRKFFRIGTAHAIPWSYQETDPVTRTAVWRGYCIDMIEKFATRMQFDYELVIPRIGDFGEKGPDGEWDGLVGDLVRGETDIVVAALTMTASREEVVDFVAPYFEQTGISIVMRKPIRKTSLFRFMTVLKLEVWLSIVGALIITGLMIWLLDKYSPYSARNSSHRYPQPCRQFTLKESFWFALTSFTPQGGGEAPKALSGRTLVAAYWLFVVLMLATFTANLAAFLTVERMQSPVQSLEQLAKQSRINYTVVKNSETHQYFINMKFAEDTLYRLWKELTLNASADDSRYRVWDYPIREQYGHILLAINDSGPVEDAVSGFSTVSSRVDADFAFIHDSSEIRFELSRNCNLTEVGDVFAERPYAVAVQQGSHLGDDISREILELQKDRFFESLKAKYWNNSLKGVCADTDDSEGITLESLGGVFIATLFGLALAMITLLGEVIFYRRKKAQQVQDKPKSEVFRKIDPKHITIGPSFKPAIVDKGHQVSHVNVKPRTPIHRLHDFNTFLN